MRTSFIGTALGIVAVTLLTGCGPGPGPMAAPPMETYGVRPATATLTVGRGTTFAAKYNGGPALSVAWRVLEPGGGTVDGAGRYLAPDLPGRYTVQAGFKYSADRTATATVTVVAPPAGQISAPSAVLPGSGGLTASIAPVPGSHYAWTISGGKLTAGSHSPSVTFRAGPGPKLVLGCRVTNAAGDVLDTSQELGTVRAVALAVSPAEVTITTGRTMTFGFTIAGGTSLGVTWTLGQPGAGSLDGLGHYLAPNVPGLYSVRATSQDDPAVTATARVKVVAQPPEGLSAPDSYRPGTPDLHARVPEQAGMTYAWEVENGNILSGAAASAVTIQAGQGPSLTLRCRITNEAGDTYATKKTLTAE